MPLTGVQSEPARPVAPAATAGTWADCMRAGAERMQEGAPGDAVGLFRCAADLRPAHPATRLNLAAALLRTGDAAQALHIYDQRLTEQPGDPTAHHGRGLALSALQDRTGALAAFRATVVHAPDAWRAWGSIADLTPNECERRHAIDRAADALEHRCQASDAPATLYGDCVSALIDARRPADALRFTHTHRARFPDKRAVHEALARASYRLGRFQDAFDHAQRALRALEPHAVAAAPRRHPFDPDAAVAALRDVTAILEARGLQPFLAAGTLLGFHRDGGPLAHDRDVDIGILRGPDGSPHVVDIIREHPTLLLRRDLRPGDRYIALTHQGIGIDVFVHDADGDHLLCGMTDRPGDIQWRFTRFQLADAEYGGHRWRTPHAPERYLAESYGPGWRRPDTGFASAISSPALHHVDPCARAYYAVTRARQCALAGDRAKAAALLRQSPTPVTFELGKTPCASDSS
ncbi:tetratricopeptide repeat protein [Luteimonas sp. XNQY3]|nr:tetratricopeptide repeat protein [Luteimonas sp. XNQY3]MCD9007503.1 tetratricopeptide repeat protein [Luteimonas sp. XNQY3]